MNTEEQLLKAKLTRVLQLIGASAEEVNERNNINNIEAYLASVKALITKYDAWSLELWSIHGWPEADSDVDILKELDNWIAWKESNAPGIDNSPEAIEKRFKEIFGEED